MANNSLIRKIFAISPSIEVLGRILYWKNVRFFENKAKKSQKKMAVSGTVSFEKIKKYLVKSGVGDGSLIIVHSAYGSLKGTGLSPAAIIDELCSLIGPRGTIAMPAIPKFKNSPQTHNYLNESSDNSLYEYDVNKSPIKTGLLPAYLHRNKNSVRSRHPINSMVAMGPLAHNLMEGNLSGINPLPCGHNSSWSKCVDNDAIIISLGTDLTHCLTAIHVAEDRLGEKWPVKNWYREKKFLIKDGEFNQEMVLKERCPKWGALHFAERTLCKDLLSNGLLSTMEIDGVVVEIIKSRALIQFLNSRNTTGYPYYWTGL